MQRFKVHSHSQAVFPYSQEPTTGSLQYHTFTISRNQSTLSLVDNSTFHCRYGLIFGEMKLFLIGLFICWLYFLIKMVTYCVVVGCTNHMETGGQQAINPHHPLLPLTPPDAPNTPWCPPVQHWGNHNWTSGASGASGVSGGVRGHWEVSRAAGGGGGWLPVDLLFPYDWYSQQLHSK